MKPKVLFVSLLLCLVGHQISYGQFLKKLKKKAEQAVENVVINKTADKAAEMAGSGMDKVFNVNFGGEQVDPSVLPDIYEFTWKYTLKMEHKQGNMMIDYYLKPDAKYFGSQPQLEGNPMANGMFMVMDEDLEIMAIFMDSENGKAGHVMKNPTDDITDAVAENEAQMNDYTYSEIGTKEILGYQCQGFQMENDEMKMIMYVAMDAPVSFNQVYGGMQPKTLPKGFDPKWLDKAENSILMEMQMTHKKKKKYNMSMNCVALEESPKTLLVSDYEFMNLNPNAKPQK